MTNQTVTVKDIYSTHTYEIIDSVPDGFRIWSIPLNGLDGYAPLCESFHPEDKKCCSINPHTLKAIKCDNAQALVKAAGIGASTLKKCRQMIARLERKQQRGKGTQWDEIRLQRLYTALPVFESLKWS